MLAGEQLNRTYGKEGKIREQGAACLASRHGCICRDVAYLWRVSLLVPCLRDTRGGRPRIAATIMTIAFRVISVMCESAGSYVVQGHMHGSDGTIREEAYL